MHTADLRAISGDHVLIMVEPPTKGGIGRLDCYLFDLHLVGLL